MKKSKLILLIVALALGLAGAFAQTVNPNVPARVDWEAYAPNPADKTFPLLPTDIGKTITVEARTAALPGARLLSPQPVIVSRNDTLLSLRYPPTNAIINGWIEVKIDGIVRFAGSLSLHKNPRPAKGATQLSYVVINGKDADTTAINQLSAQVASDTAFFNAQQNIFQSATSGAYDVAVSANAKATSASAVASTALSTAQSVSATAASALTGVAANSAALQSRLNYVTSSGLFSTATADVVQFDNASWERKSGTVTTSTPGYGGVYFPGPAGYYYERRFWGDVDIRMFGAVSGDGIDDSPAIQAAINYIPNTVSNRGGSVFIPGGFWDVFTKITLPINVRVSIRGIGVRLYNEVGGSGSCLVWRGASGGTMMEYDGGAATRHNGPMIWGVNFWSSDLTSTMLRLKYVTHWSVRECGFGQGGTGLETDAGVGVASGNDNAWSVIDNNTFIACANYGTKVTNGTYGFTFSNGDCQVAATAIGLYLDKYSQNVRVIGGKFDRGNPAIYNAGGNNSFVGIHVENTALGMQIIRDASVTFSGKGNYVQGTFNNTLGGGTGVGLQLGSGSVNTNISIVGTSLTTTLQDLGADQYEGYINGFHRYQNKLSTNIIFELLVGTITSGQFYASGNGPIIAGASGAPNVIIRPNTNGGLQVQNTSGTLITNFNADGTATHRGTLKMQYATGASDPTTADIPAGYELTWKNTTTGVTKRWINDGGTLKSSAAFN